MSSDGPRPHEALPWNVYLTVGFIAFLIAHTVIAAFGSSYVLQDPDTFWHIRTGNWILEHGSVPAVDTFSYTAYGQPWIANDWLADVILAIAFDLAGWRGVVELTAVGVGTVTAILCLYLTRVLRLSVAVGLTTITALLISPHYLARPLIFSYAIMLTWVIILLETYETDDRLPLVLIPLMILWANIHGGFTIGLVFLYVFAAYTAGRHVVMRRFGRLRQELFLVFAVTVAALVTPYGIEAVLITPKVLSMKFALQNITEWRAPDFQVQRLHLLYLVGVFSGVMALGVRLRGPRLPIFMLMMYLGLSYLRGLVQFMLVVPLIFACPIAARAWFLGAKNSSNSGSSDPVVQFLRNHYVAVRMGCFAAAAIITAAAWSMVESRPPGSAAPQAAVDFVKRAGISGNVFNSYDFGGYLIFSGIPTAIDGRAHPFGDAFLRRYFNALNLVDVGDAFELFNEYHMNWAILKPADALGKALRSSSMWEKVYSDEYAEVFVRRE